MPKNLHFPAFSGLALILSVSMLAGCSANFVPSSVEPEKVPIGNIQGTVHGGQAPVSGAQIYLFAAGTGGYGTSATSLISPTAPSAHEDGNGNYYVVTDANGNFALGGDYTCTQGQQVYMVAVGGNPGLTGTVNNTAIVQMAGLGQCPAAGNLAAQVPYLVINEVTTVAFAYAMSGFATTAYNVSTDSTGTTAIANAMANATNIVNLWPGAAPAVANGNANSVNPQAKIYALANILATCVNTASATSSACTSLFSAARSSVGVAATDEASAIFNIAHNQAQNVTNIWNLTPATPVFSPTLSAQPTDWTLPVVYQGVVGKPVSIAFDASGNAWIGDSTKGVVKIGPQGAVSTFSTDNGKQPFKAIYGVAVAPNGMIWATDYSRGKVNIMTSAGVVTTQITTGNLQDPAAVAFDQSGNAFVVNESAASISIFNSSGVLAAQDTCPNGSCNVGGMNHPNWIAVDTSGNAWIPSQTNNIGELQYQSGTYSNSNTNYQSTPSLGLAFDGNGHLWVSGYQKNELEEVSSAGALLATVTGSGLSTPQTVAVDGAGNVWIGNGGAAVISGFSNTGVPLNSAGLTTGSSGDTLAVTPDSSGNLWSANSDGTVSQLLGAATPVSTPILPGSFGVRP